jgi:hypothetical protein
MAAMVRDNSFHFGYREGFNVWQGDTFLTSQTFEASAQGVALFDGDAGGLFRAARWELWQVG